jgi:hypothetical protein
LYSLPKPIQQWLRRHVAYESSRNDVDGSDRRVALPQSGPTPEGVKAQTAFIAQPTLVDVDIAATNGSINPAVAGAVSGYTATKRPGGVIDAIVAAGAATAADRRCSF